MDTTQEPRLHHSHSLNPDPRALHPLNPQPSRESSGAESTSSCSPVLDTVWDWGMCGGSRTFVTAMEEVSGRQALSSKTSNALNLWV